MTSPSTSTSSTTRVRNASCARSSATSPCARWPKRKFSPTLTCSAPSRPTSTSSMKSCGDWLANAPSNGITTSSCTPRPGDQVGLGGQRRDQLRRLVRRDDRARVRLEGQDGVRAAHHLAVAEVDAVELADGDVARAGLRIGEPGDLHQPRKPTTGLSVPSPRGSARAIRPSGVDEPHDRAPPAVRGRNRHAVPRPARVVARQRDRGQEPERVVERHEAAGVGDVERADRRAPQLEAVRVAEVGDQRAHVGARAALDRERRPLPVAPQQRRSGARRPRARAGRPASPARASA